MTDQEARQLVGEYGGAVAKGDTTPFRRMSLLPSSKQRIKDAFYINLENIIKDSGKLPEQIGNALVVCYSMLDWFIEDEEAVRLNKVCALFKEGKEVTDSLEEQDYIKASNASGESGLQLMDEINAHIGRCYRRYGCE